MTDTTDNPGTLAARFLRNRAERDELSARLTTAKDELRQLMFRGRAISMEVSEMSNLAGISRDTANRIIREAGAVSWKEKQAWAHGVLEAIPKDRGDINQQMFRSLVEIELYSALGTKRDSVPPVLNDIFERVASTIRAETGPSFVPRVDQKRLSALREWPEERFEIVQLGAGASLRYQLRLNGVDVEPPRTSAEDVARDLLRHGGKKPTYIDRTGPACMLPDGRRISWDVLKDLKL